MKNQKKEETTKQLSKTNCSGVPGECGPGRVCVMTVVGNYCATEEQADKDIARAKERQMMQKIDDIHNKLTWPRY